VKFLIFVYGTLKHDFHNHRIIADQKFIGHGETLGEHWQMYSLGGFPGVVHGDKTIVGELYEVDEQAFQRCDRLEGHPHFYRREIVEVLDSDGVVHHPWMYIYQGEVEHLQKVEGW
jgi:gamma-glutamylcyclotransferase (GGCT)/AIG2-like uncharacterized protein YtfP